MSLSGHKSYNNQNLTGNNNLETSINDIETDVLNLQTQVINNDTDITNLQNEDINLQNQITSNDTDITNLQNEDINLQNQITSNDIDITNLQNEDINLQNQITSNDIDITNLQNEDINLQNQITNNDNDIIALQNEDINLQNQITSNDGDITNLQNQITNNDDEIHDSFIMTCTNVDSSIDNKLTRSSHVNTHSYFHKCIQFNASNYRNYYIGLLGDNTTNNNQFAICGDGGGGNDPNVICAFDDGGNIYMANNLYLDQTLECNGVISNNLNVNGNIDLATSGKIIFPDDSEQTTSFKSTYDAYNNQTVLNGLSFTSGIQYNPFTLEHEILLNNLSYRVLEKGLIEYDYPSNSMLDLVPILVDLTVYGSSSSYNYINYYDLVLPSTQLSPFPPLFNDPPQNPIPDFLIPTVPDFHRPGNNNNGGEILPQVPNPTGQPFTILSPAYDTDIIYNGKLKIGWYQLNYEGQADNMNWVNAFLGRIEIKDGSGNLVKTSFWSGRNIGGGGDDITVSFNSHLTFYSDIADEYSINLNTKYWFGTQINAEVIGRLIIQKL